jgi:8-oxo-dGTP diphosphatase
VSPPESRAAVRAAGCVVWRPGRKEPEVLLVHRPRWKDWSFPKGKLDPGEPAFAAAVREVEEETGLHVHLGPSLPDTRYTVSGGQPKVVNYWCAKPPKRSDVSGYRPNTEIDDVRWVRVSKAARRLTYEYDSDLLHTFLAGAFDTSPLIVIRHAHARSRKTWKHEDSERPLRAEGKEEAHRIAGVLAAYGIKRVVSSDAVRCVDTVLPYVDGHNTTLKLEAGLSEEAFDAQAMEQRVRREFERNRRVAICSHRPVLPDLQRALGLEPVALDPGAMLVVHRKDGVIGSVEQLPTP